MIIQIDRDYWFPDPHLGEDDGFFAVGGDLSVPRLMLAYANGIFPWYSYKLVPQPYWCCPLERFVIYPDEIHVSHSMRTLFNKKRFRVEVNENFEKTLRHCMEVNNRHKDVNAWLGEHIIKAYKPLNEMGVAMSFEVWDGEELMGGLYGERFGYVFIGESMFSMKPNGSKIALIALARMMKDCGVEIIDCQCRTDHLASMGGKYISYGQYMEIMNKNLNVRKITRRGDNGFIYYDLEPFRCLENRRFIYYDGEDDEEELLDDQWGESADNSLGEDDEVLTEDNLSEDENSR